jgi:hypothetical protein
LKITQIPNFIKILLVGAELFHADGHTDMAKHTFCNFANAPKECHYCKNLGRKLNHQNTRLYLQLVLDIDLSQVTCLLSMYKTGRCNSIAPAGTVSYPAFRAALPCLLWFPQDTRGLSNKSRWGKQILNATRNDSYRNYCCILSGREKKGRNLHS